MFARGKSKERTSNRKVTPPSPSYMSNEQFASYLADLRQNRIARPGGARPQPENNRRDSGRPSLTSNKRSSLGGASFASDTSMNPRGQYAVPPSIISRPSVAGSVTSRYSNTSARGRDYYPKVPGSTSPLKPSEVVPSATYIERGQRWMEKEEAFSLKQAMDDMDLREREKAEPAEKTEPAEEDEEEKRIHAAALDEAADLVWQHQNGVKPPEPDAPYRYKPHMRKNSYAYARTASAGYNGADVEPTGLRRDMGSRSVSGSSTSSDGNTAASRSHVSLGSTAGKSGGRPSLEKSRENSMESEQPTKAYRGLASGPRPMAPKSSDRRRSSLKRNISGEVQKPFSGDQIWEEPEGASSPATKATSSKATPANAQPLRAKARNPLNRVQFAPEVPESNPKLPEAPPRPVSKIEIHRNPPSQSRNPLYTSNSSSETPAAPREDVPRKNGVEIRGDDIRSATSMKLKDRSEKLPTPAYVSDSPGRPIVSFDASWKVPEKDPGTDKKPDPRHRSPFFRRDQAGKQPSPASTPGPASSPRPQAQPATLRQASSVPAISVVEARDLPRPQSTPQQPRGRNIAPPAVQVESVADEPPLAAAATTVPSIAVSEPEASPSKNPSIPSISVEAAPAIPSIITPDNDEDGSSGVPIIITPDEASNSSSNSKPTPSARPLPTPVKGPVGRFRHEAQRSRGHWSPAPGSPAGSRATARCHECAQYIEGRFVKLAGGNERFHPQCFTCYMCGTSLEALEISPEPESFRSARLERIARRAAGEILDEEPGKTMAEDGDERLRFFCHLDWHEQFAPKCKHCRTPIIGEHVVALGAHWHYGHFFCAECGDPFEQGMTHIEKDGYAWCVGCQTKRTERRAPKCKGCKKAVIGQYVRALGGEWHDECFRCGTCGGGFDDGQVFPREASDGFMEVLCTPCRARELKG
ncbi:hypothetical protein MCOR02_010438 [Pyricularia oryzae]|nr:hypothetical protein MCOR02_010438 [Pyricularia oryzae]KAI6315345.1 hypothetical protein MCOR34_004682 [Pyricularia oryzae]KAI6468856.1 hypothetical protein MCOR17_003959 [Pyricularia oryzae]KAI6510920.1 hypothetical protein MCOR13_000844 [Pyricularia oryzae]KAI6596653.1 hypothetical protein MCOR04_002905 [Pyricularia oryzae]